jgi:L-asparaginase II
MTNPVLAEVLRGQTVESIHTGSYAVCNDKGAVALSVGDIATPVFPRSAVKAFQCLPMVESGAADHFGLNDEEIALCCASHNGEPDHVRVARSILKKCGNTEDMYECGAHWPSSHAAQINLARSGGEALQVHNNCSGKHAGMLALARQLGVPSRDYVTASHPVQQAVAKTLGEYCDVDIAKAPVGIDGCSVPTWAMPLRNIAMGFARFGASKNPSCQRIIKAVRDYPFMVGGTKSFDTEMMQKVPRLFIKVGAEGVYCGCIADAGLGFALKIDDGASRAAEMAVVGMLSKLDSWSAAERQILKDAQFKIMSNWCKIRVGKIHAV